jgi:polyhydroxyalkanoate depolymerase
MDRLDEAMLYRSFQAASDMLLPARWSAGLASSALDAFPPPWVRTIPSLARMAAGWELLARAGLTYHRPDYGIDSVTVGGEQVPVEEETTLSTPFGDLVRFKKPGIEDQPRLLLVAPLSGHFATLLRGTLQTLLPDNDVYITDWKSARDIPLSEGLFGFDEYVEHVIRFLEAIGPGAHLMSVCQPCAHALAAVALMAEDDNPCTPRSMTLMAGPVDVRINPTKVNRLAAEHSIEWFEQRLITRTPQRYKGAGRRVYPGFVQLTAFMAMNPNRHVEQHIELWTHLATGRRDEAEAIKAFYDEYFAVLDLTAEFYLETVRPRGDPQDRPDDRGGRARRHLQRGPDHGRAYGLPEHLRQPQTPPPPAGRGALWRVQRAQVGRTGLSDGPQYDPGGRLRPFHRTSLVQ